MDPKSTETTGYADFVAVGPNARARGRTAQLSERREELVCARRSGYASRSRPSRGSWARASRC